MSIEYIKRPIYFDRIKPFIGKQIIKILTGQRRVGKSYIMLQLIDEIKLIHPGANIIYLNLELHEFDSIRSYTVLYEYIDAKLVAGKQNFLLIDEVQEVKSFELCLSKSTGRNKM